MSHSKSVSWGNLRRKSESSCTYDFKKGTRGDNIFSINSLNLCVGDSGPAIMGRPLRSSGTGIWIYSAGLSVQVWMIVLFG